MAGINKFSKKCINKAIVFFVTVFLPTYLARLTKVTPIYKKNLNFFKMCQNVPILAQMYQNMKISPNATKQDQTYQNESQSMKMTLKYQNDPHSTKWTPKYHNEPRSTKLNLIIPKWATAYQNVPKYTKLSQNTVSIQRSNTISIIMGKVSEMLPP